MSGKLVGEVLDHAPADLTETERWVLVALAEAANEKTRIARYDTSTEKLAGRTRRAPGTVRNSLSSLVDRGLIRTLLTAHRGKVQHYELARLKTGHRFTTEKDNQPCPTPQTPRSPSPSSPTPQPKSPSPKRNGAPQKSTYSAPFENSREPA